MGKVFWMFFSSFATAAADKLVSDFKKEKQLLFDAYCCPTDISRKCRAKKVENDIVAVKDMHRFLGVGGYSRRACGRE
jgi:hypothetical protein